MPFKPEASRKANMGKFEEKEVQRFLETYSAKHAEFDFLRLPDAHSCMGRIKAMPADYEFFQPACHGLIEVKASQHAYRLAKDKVAQMPLMRKRELAGGSCWIIVRHTEEDLWRVVRPKWLTPGLPSWSLAEYPLFSSAESALLSTGVFNV